MSYVAAKVLLNGFIDLAHYRDSELADPATHELAKRIKMDSDGQGDPNALMPVSMEPNVSIHEAKAFSCNLEKGKL